MGAGTPRDSWGTGSKGSCQHAWHEEHQPLERVWAPLSVSLSLCQLVQGARFPVEKKGRSLRPLSLAVPAGTEGPQGARFPVEEKGRSLSGGRGGDCPAPELTCILLTLIAPPGLGLCCCCWLWLLALAARRRRRKKEEETKLQGMVPLGAQQETEKEQEEEEQVQKSQNDAASGSRWANEVSGMR